MQVNDVSAMRGTGTLPTDFASTPSTSTTRDATQPQALLNSPQAPAVPGDVISLSPAAALLCGSAMAP